MQHLALRKLIHPESFSVRAVRESAVVVRLGVCGILVGRNLLACKHKFNTPSGFGSEAGHDLVPLLEGIDLAGLHFTEIESLRHGTGRGG